MVIRIRSGRMRRRRYPCARSRSSSGQSWGIEPSLVTTIVPCLLQIHFREPSSAIISEPIQLHLLLESPRKSRFNQTITKRSPKRKNSPIGLIFAFFRRITRVYAMSAYATSFLVSSSHSWSFTQAKLSIRVRRRTSFRSGCARSTS